MKIISLWQPYAAAVSWGWKKNETRSWSTKYRGPIAIHAAKRPGKDGEHGETLNKALREAKDSRGWGLPGYGFAYGAIVARAILHSVVAAEYEIPEIDPLEYYLGDYARGRFAWQLVDVELLHPVAYRGAQGLRDLPEAVANSLRPYNS